MNEGIGDGSALGFKLGCGVGKLDGKGDGGTLGRMVGGAVGWPEGIRVGELLGRDTGTGEGGSEGSGVGCKLSAGVIHITDAKTPTFLDVFAIMVSTTRGNRNQDGCEFTAAFYDMSVWSIKCHC